MKIKNAWRPANAPICQFGDKSTWRRPYISAILCYTLELQNNISCICHDIHSKPLDLWKEKLLMWMQQLWLILTSTLMVHFTDVLYCTVFLPHFSCCNTLTVYSLTDTGGGGGGGEVTWWSCEECEWVFKVFHIHRKTKLNAKNQGANISRLYIFFHFRTNKLPYSRDNLF